MSVNHINQIEESSSEESADTPTFPGRRAMQPDTNDDDDDISESDIVPDEYADVKCAYP